MLFIRNNERALHGRGFCDVKLEVILHNGRLSLNGYLKINKCLTGPPPPPFSLTDCAEGFEGGGGFHRSVTEWGRSVIPGEFRRETFYPSLRKGPFPEPFSLFREMRPDKSQMLSSTLSPLRKSNCQQTTFHSCK